MEIFEIIMLLCFGLAWPFAIAKSIKAKANGSKSILFLSIILLGYISGIIHKAFYNYNWVLALYIINSCMVLTEIGLYFRNEYFIYRLSDEEKQLYQTYFNKMPQAIFAALLKLAEYKIYPAKQLLIKENTIPEEVFYLLDGKVEIIKNDTLINELSKNSFLGEMSFLTSNPTTADVVTVTPIKCLVWKKAILSQHHEMLKYYNMYLAIDLISKIKSTEEFRQLPIHDSM